MSEKQEFRNLYKTLRNGMSRHDADALSARICDHILDSGMFRGAQYLYAYYPLENEVDVRPVARAAWQEGKHVAFPKVFGDEMRFFEVKDFGQLAEGAYGVMEPVEEAGAVPVDWLAEDPGAVPVDWLAEDPGAVPVGWLEEDPGAVPREGAEPSGRAPGSRLLVLVPGVAFDRQGNRMGHGKGYYDRFFDEFAESQKRGPSVDGPLITTLLGVAYDGQIADSLPAESHDLTVPYLVTEDGIILSAQSCG